ncbi:unnamed protein product [Leuciscus chuanchicus]
MRLSKSEEGQWKEWIESEMETAAFEWCFELGSSLRWCREAKTIREENRRTVKENFLVEASLGRLGSKMSPGYPLKDLGQFPVSSLFQSAHFLKCSRCCASPSGLAAGDQFMQWKAGILFSLNFVKSCVARVSEGQTPLSTVYSLEKTDARL